MLEYLRRRAIRLFPPYWAAWLITGLAVYFAPVLGAEAAYFPSFDVRAGLWQLGILYVGPHWGWAWWSLSVEILFYLLLPVIVPFFSRIPARTSWMLVMLALAAAISMSLQAGARDFVSKIPIEFGGLVLYAPCFLAGLILSRVDLPRTVARCLMLVGVALLATSSIAPVGQKIAGYGLLYTGLVSRALDPASGISRMLSGWFLVWLGERSYSLFLIHCAVILMVSEAFAVLMPSRGLGGLLAVRATSVVGSLLAAMLLFSYIERRFAYGLATGNVFWPRKPPPRGAVACIVVPAT
jgi:peptidoglycan/LPS O-acetylase OafA/YrhL